MLTGQRIYFDRNCALEFGYYVQIHEEHGNSMDTISLNYIAIRTTSNTQEGCYFFNLSARQKTIRFSWTALTMPSCIVNKINRMSRRKPKGLSFLDGRGYMIPYDKEDDGYDSGDYK